MSDSPDVVVLMGSRGDWEVMRHTADTLERLGVAYDVRAISAHRAPEHLFEYAEKIEARGVKVVIAGAGMAAALPGMLAAKLTIPVLGVPIAGSSLNGMDALLSIVQMPGGVPVGALAVGKAGAKNAALLAASILGLSDASIRDALQQYRAEQTADVIQNDDPRKSV